MTNRLICSAACVLFSVLVVASVRAQPPAEIVSDRDNTLYEDATGAVSNGAGDWFFSGRTAKGAIRRGLFRFDIAGNVPAGSTINSVSVTLNMDKTTSGLQTIDLHRVPADWGEGTSDALGQEGSGAVSTPGDATWIHTFFNTNTWTNVGGDFDPTASASQNVGGTGPYTWASTAQMVTDVQDWLDNPGNNFGWILIGNETVFTTSKRFHSRTNIAPPTLIVKFSEPVATIPTMTEWAMIAMIGLVLVAAVWGLRRRRAGHVAA